MAGRFLLALAGLACACIAPAGAQDDGEDGAAAGVRAESLAVNDHVRIPLVGDGTSVGDIQMATEVFRPPGPGPFPVVVFSHGRAGDAATRASLKRGVSHAQLRFWLARGDAVVAPIRPGYGQTGGADPENTGARFDDLGQCKSQPDFAASTAAASRTVQATLAWLRVQPWADARHILLVGQSVGGLTTVAAGAKNPPGVVGYIDFAGGAGGSPERSPGKSCAPGSLTVLYGGFGKTTTVPNLWVYAMNDQYWGPDAPVRWHDAFAQGGSPTTFVHAPAVADGDGHGLSRHSHTLWAPFVERFLASVPFDRPEPASAQASSNR